MLNKKGGSYYAVTMMLFCNLSFTAPYARVVFGGRSQCTSAIVQEECPLWNETIIIDNISLTGDPDFHGKNRPCTFVQIYHKERSVSL